MSCQKGNTSRTRPQKHQNSRAFKNTLHDKSKKTQIINNTQFTHSCDRCKAIVEWKIKYKKYKQLKSAKTCVKCSNKTVKQSYHIMCIPCAEKLKVCAKCGTSDFKNSSDPQLDIATNPKAVEEDSSGEESEIDEDELEEGL